MDPDELYSESHRDIQECYGQRGLADRTVEAIVHSTLTEQDIAFIVERDFFFLSTVDSDGHPTVSYKGGAPGFVRVEDNELVFPCYDGNGMFLSMGNITAEAKVGLLFMDFERPRRLRVQGAARLDETSARDAFPGAIFLVRVAPHQIFVNCPRYVHKYARVQTSKYVPNEGGIAPLAQWKRLPVVQDVLSPCDQAAAQQAGLISLEDYGAKVEAGEG
jgi:predicted pyridoxine 5'-phosphate oxidase superfamily flavin-nucleotide-binding protein